MVPCGERENLRNELVAIRGAVAAPAYQSLFKPCCYWQNIPSHVRIGRFGVNVHVERIGRERRRVNQRLNHVASAVGNREVIRSAAAIGYPAENALRNVTAGSDEWGAQNAAFRFKS